MNKTEINNLKSAALARVREYGAAGRAKNSIDEVIDAANDAIRALCKCLDAQADYIDELMTAGSVLADLANPDTESRSN